MSAVGSENANEWSCEACFGSISVTYWVCVTDWWRRDQMLLTRCFRCRNIPSSCSLTVIFQWGSPTFSSCSLFCCCWDLAETLQTMSRRHRWRRAEWWRRRKQKKMAESCRPSVFAFFFLLFIFKSSHICWFFTFLPETSLVLFPRHTHTHTHTHAHTHALS